ncbi:MAG: DMT family transporter, partial [Burkholderiales bacterium]|nr:DMT family transporter [Burkholderiales bacterium]
MDAVTRERRALILLWVVPALWSSNYLIARAARGVVAPHLLAFGRWSLALALLLPVAGAGLWRKRALLREEAWHCLVLGAFGMWICGAWVYLGGQTTSATNIALFYAATPIAISVAGVFLLGEPLSLPRRWAVALALFGVLLVIAKGDPANLLGVRFVVGDAWILAAAASWVAYSVLLKRWPSGLGPAERLAAIIAGGLLVLAPFTIQESWQAGWPLPDARALGLIALAAVLPGVLSYGAYSYLQRELGASRTALLL